MATRKNKKQTKNPPSPFHNWLGSLLKELLTPVKISVKDEVKVMAQTPKADFFLLGHRKKGWTEQQKDRLCDGIRDLDVPQVLIEFKYSESVNEDVLGKALGDWVRYRSYHKLPPDAIRMIVMSRMTTNAQLLKDFGYQQKDKEGVYRTNQMGFRNVDLILLNELADTPYNAPYKIFGSVQTQINSAFMQLKNSRIFKRSNRLEELLKFLYDSLTSSKTIQSEIIKMTIEEYLDKGPALIKARIEAMPAEKKLEILADDVDFKEKFLDSLPQETRLKGISEEMRLQGISKEKRLQGISEEMRLEGISLEKLEQYLAEMKKQ